MKPGAKSFIELQASLVRAAEKYAGDRISYLMDHGIAFDVAFAHEVGTAWAIGWAAGYAAASED